MSIILLGGLAERACNCGGRECKHDLTHPREHPGVDLLLHAVCRDLCTTTDLATTINGLRLFSKYWWTATLTLLGTLADLGRSRSAAQRPSSDLY
jgi:hypothetical protein